MDATVFFETRENRMYLYDFYLNIFLLVHPLIKVFYLLGKRGVEVCEWADCVRKQGVQYDDFTYQSQLRRYLLYKKNGCFQQLPLKRTTTVIDKLLVESALDGIKQIVFEVTDKCNLNCKYCAYGELYSNYDKRDTAYLSSDSAKSLLDYFIERWKRHSSAKMERSIYISFYGGEPLLNVPLIEELIEYVETNFPSNVHPVFTMTTNGLLLKKNIGMLVEKKFQILVSIDGDNEGNSYRLSVEGKNPFPIVYSNLKYIQTQYPSFFNDNINFNSVLHNMNSVDSILYFFQKEFGKIPRVSEINDNGVKKEKKGEFNKIYKNIYENLSYIPDRKYIENQYFVQLPKVVSMGVFISQFTDNKYANYADFFLKKNFYLRKCSGTCIPFSKKIYLTVNDKLLPCEKIGHEHMLGNIVHGKINLDIESVANEYSMFNEKLKQQCDNCYLLKSCTMCMFYFSDISEPICSEFSNEESFKRYLIKHISTLEAEPGLYRKICNEVIFE